MSDDMSVRLDMPQPALDSEISFSYFVRNRDGSTSRVGLAKVLDMSETGLCMEISPLDSDLFMESFTRTPEFNRNIELQIFCRSHPSNVFVEGTVRWFKQKKELGPLSGSSGSLDICAGVVFSIDDAEKRVELSELIGHLDNPTVGCGECGTPVSVDGSFCYECGIRLITKREVVRKAIYEVLAPEDKSF